MQICVMVAKRMPQSPREMQIEKMSKKMVKKI